MRSGQAHGGDALSVSSPRLVHVEERSRSSDVARAALAACGRQLVRLRARETELGHGTFPTDWDALIARVGPGCRELGG